MSGAKARTRQVTWDDPLAGLRAARAVDGLTYLRAMLRGECPHPPIARLLGYALTEVEEGRAVFVVEPGEHHYNPLGVVHGGLLATVLDSAMACAIHTRTPAGDYSTTLELNVNYVRPVTLETPPLRVEGRVLHMGSRVATAEGRVHDDQQRLYAHATTTCLMLRDGGSSEGKG